MSNVKEYKDIVAFHPGYYIADIIDDMETVSYTHLTLPTT